MDVHFFNTEHWHDLHLQLQAEWEKMRPPQPPAASPDALSSLAQSSFAVRVFPDLPTALYEVSHGCAQFYAHKKSVIIQEGHSPYLSHTAKLFLREGYTVDSLADPLQCELKKDLLFSLMQVDHPVMGQKFDWRETSRKLAEKKIFSLMVHHALHEFPELDPYSIHLIQGKNICIALCGERFKALPLFTNLKDWAKIKIQISDEMQAWQKRLSLAENPDLQKCILKNEALFPFPDNVKGEMLGPRYFDRSVLCLKNSNSDVLKKKIAAAFPQHFDKVHHTNLCDRHMVVDQLAWWKMPFEPSILSSILILEMEPSMDDSFIDWLVEQDQTVSSFGFEVKI